MANEANVNNNERGIKDSWSLLAFAHLKGMPRPNTSKNSVTGKEGGYQLCRAGNLNMDEAINLFA